MVMGWTVLERRILRFDSRQKYKQNSNKRLCVKSRARLRGLQADTFVQVTFASLRVKYRGDSFGCFGKSDSDLLYQDEVHGPLFEQVDKTVD